MRIGITPRLIENVDYDEMREAWDVCWSGLLLDLGYFPVLVSVNFKSEEFKRLELDGVLFSGGNDLSIIDPCVLSKRRDAFEKDLFEYCLGIDIPVLGVCRGMQFVAHSFGENLHEVDAHIGTNHSIEVVNRNDFKSIKSIKIVNSFHRYGLKQVSDIWDVLAVAPDGSIEAIIHKNLKIMGHMWHPERESPNDHSQKLLIKEFYEGSK